ncbi:DsbA family protein [Scytonema sp. NUACC26]|uniref:DsbA family protein n=1 Tax=Scytonema sp. NUACC26 TaxID=3140176 RepID=UPI0034DC8364
MYAFSYLVGKLLVWLRAFTVVGFICMVLSWSLPAQAARMNSQLEQQVLQIIREHPEAIVESVQAYQQKQRAQIQQAQQVFVQQMKTDPLSVIGQSPTTGSKELKILLVEFSDFECPYCAQAHKTLKQFMVKHRDEVTLVYKHFPLTNIHPQAVPAATAAWAAQQQGKFWDYQDALFTNQKQLGEQFYLDTAKNLNLDLEKFRSDRLLATAAIEKDSQLAQILGLSGTPFFIMNGEVLSGAVQLGEIEDLLTRVRKT